VAPALLCTGYFEPRLSKIAKLFVFSESTVHADFGSKNLFAGTRLPTFSYNDSKLKWLDTTIMIDLVYLFKRDINDLEVGAHVNFCEVAGAALRSTRLVSNFGVVIPRTNSSSSDSSSLSLPPD
jgi:hypothetical protein